MFFSDIVTSLVHTFFFITEHFSVVHSISGCIVKDSKHLDGHSNQLGSPTNQTLNKLSSHLVVTSKPKLDTKTLFLDQNELLEPNLNQIKEEGYF